MYYSLFLVAYFDMYSDSLTVLNPDMEIVDSLSWTSTFLVIVIRRIYLRNTCSRARVALLNKYFIHLN